ncbi:hypothetical protein [Sphaerisporangium sp. TRM90804]|uniref:hypothetical protein n=1 Tax=Sphaerisporangium sp. TRM90804 TaxID=3031113 RepID=UPI00244A38E0|nr:hypothetical protein [Sphaerisporangium sp. TRM90804]MDH2429120.1 hypothetical protein [Sphaerisporangium sp. TRM90804]
MDPALAGLAGAAGAALVQAMTKDTWEATKARLAALFRRYGGDDAADMSHQLEATEQRLDGSPTPPEQAVAEERERWTALLAAFLARHAEAAHDLQDAVHDLREALGEPPPSPEPYTVVQQVTAGRDTFTAGRDQHLTITPDDDDDDA